MRSFNTVYENATGQLVISVFKSVAAGKLIVSSLLDVSIYMYTSKLDARSF